MLAGRKGRERGRSLHTVCVPLQSDPCTLFSETLKFLLLNRNQIGPQLGEHFQTALRLAAPAPNTEGSGQRVVSTTARMKKLSATVKRALQLSEAFHKAMDALGYLFYHEPIIKAAILLGPSPARAREAYVFHFQPYAASQAAFVPMSQQQPTKHVQNAGKKLVRTLLASSSSIQAWEHMPGPTKLHLLVQRPLDAPLSNQQQRGNSGSCVMPDLSGVCNSSMHTRPPVSFTPKRQLEHVLSTKVPTVVTIDFCNSSAPGQLSPGSKPKTARIQQEQSIVSAKESSDSEGQAADSNGDCARIPCALEALETLSAATRAMSLRSQQHHAQATSSYQPLDTASSQPTASFSQHVLLLHHHRPAAQHETQNQALQNHGPPSPHTNQRQDHYSSSAMQHQIHQDTSSPGLIPPSSSTPTKRACLLRRSQPRINASSKQAIALGGHSLTRRLRQGGIQEQDQGNPSCSVASLEEGMAWWLCSVSIKGLRVKPQGGL